MKDSNSAGNSRFPWTAAALIPVLMAVAATGCLTQSTITPTRPVGERLSPKLNPFVHFEDGTVLFIGVDGRAARYVEEGGIFPLGLGLANQSKGSLSFTRESFVLETASGERYPLVSVQEYNRDYERSRSDVRLADSFADVMRTRFGNYNFVTRRLFPLKGGGGTAPDVFELGRRFWTQLYVYFPIPETGIHDQRFKLLVNTKEVEETFVVSFSLK